MVEKRLSNLPTVSIVIPSLNRAEYLAQTIESILRQNYPNIECIIVDGGSTDGTGEILRRYEGRIKLIQEPDEGNIDAINKGLKMSRCEILAWLNADDCYAVPDSISKAVEHFQKNRDIDVIYGNYVVISEKGETISDILKPREWDLEYAVKYCFHTITQPASFMRRSILEKVGWLDTRSDNNLDFDLWIRIGLIGNIKYVPTLFAYRRDGKGVTQKKSMAKATVKIIERFFSEENLPHPFNSKKFKRRAMSNAYLVGSNFALLGPYYKEFISYLFKSAAADPVNLPRIAAKTTRTIFSVTFPKRLKTAIKKSMVRNEVVL